MKDLLWRGYFPFPPSINETYKTSGKKLILSDNAKTFSSYATAIINNEKIGKTFIDGWIEVVILIRPPVELLSSSSRYKMDVHNYHKLILDILQDNGVYKNDSFISPLIIGYGDETTVPIREINYVKQRLRSNVAVKVLGGCGVFIYKGSSDGLVDLSGTHQIPEISYKKIRGIEA